MRHFRDTTASAMPQAVAGAAAAEAVPVLQADVVTSPDALLALREEWEALARLTPSASPFQDF